MTENNAQKLFNTFFMLNKEVKNGRDKCMRLDKEEIKLICEGLSNIEGVSSSLGESAYTQYLDNLEKRAKEYEENEEL